MITEEGLILSSLLDIRQRFLRLLIGIEEAIPSADPGARTVLNAYRSKVLKATRHYSETVADFIIGAQSASDDDPTRWTQSARHRMTNAALKNFDRLSSAHYEIYRHLHRTDRPREDLVFLLFRSIGLSLMSREHERLVSVYASEQIVWESLEMKADGDSRAVAVGVPWVELLTPLRWPLVAHEVGHFFLPNGVLREYDAKTIAGEYGWLEEQEIRAFSEILADLVAQKYFGDAYAYAFVREAHHISTSHSTPDLPPKKRIELLGGPKQLIASIPATWMSRPYDGVEFGSTGDEKPYVPIPDAELSKMRTIAVEIVGEPTVTRPECVEKARLLLRNGEAYGAVDALGCKTEADNARALDLVRNGFADITRDEVADVLALVRHQALSDAEIYEAVWLEESERTPDSLIEALTVVGTDQDFVLEAREIESRDTWLARSLQSAAVHRWIDEARSLLKP